MPAYVTRGPINQNIPPLWRAEILNLKKHYPEYIPDPARIPRCAYCKSVREGVECKNCGAPA